jgi:hypothetical protein
VTDPDGTSYILNEVFRKMVGGLIDTPKFSICTKEDCDYSLYFKMKNVKSIIIECQPGEKIETITYLHFGPYYERKYGSGETTTYYLPYDPIVSDLDITITLTPVIGKSGLYINAQTLPQ